MLIPKVLVLALGVSLLSITSAVADDGPTAGFVVGANFATVRLAGSDATGISPGTRAGVWVGGFARWPITSIVAIQPEVAYSQRHFKVADTVGAFSATEKWDWIDVPILAHITVWHTGRHAVFVVGGPGFGFLARAREEAAGTTSDVKDDVKRVNVSVVVGAGVSLGKVGLEGRYDAGLKDLNKDNRLGDDLTVKSRMASIDVTWRVR